MAANNYTTYVPSIACYGQKTACLPLDNPTAYGQTIFNIVLSVILALTAVLGNGLVFAAYYFSESLRNPAYTILMSLAATDFLSGMFSIPLFIVENALVIQSCNEAFCSVENLVRLSVIFLTGATLLNLSITTLDRYIAVCHTYKYPELVTDSRVKKVLAMLWLFWAVIAFVCQTYIDIRTSTMVLIVIPPNVFLIVVLYVMIFREIRRIDANPDNAENIGDEEERKKHARKSVKTLALILGLLCISFVPFILLGTLKQTLMSGMSNASRVLRLYASNAAFSNSSLNVLVYYWRNEKMREAMQKVIRKIRQRFHNEVST